MNTIKYIVIHCSATRSNMTYTSLQLDRDHRARGFRSAGYHFYIRRNGDTEALRPTTEPAAHAKGYNHCSIGVCYEGGLDAAAKPADTRTPQQKTALRRLLMELRNLYPQASIVGHRDLSYDRNYDGSITPDEWMKACPCFDAHAEYSRL